MKNKQDSANIRVVCRVRPFNEKELASSSLSALEFRPSGIRLRQRQFHSATPDSGFFTFDHVLGPETTQPQFYEKVAAPLVSQIFEGLNLTIFAYGQTSSGKTYTMQGYGQDKGLVPRLLGQIFRRVEHSLNHIQFRLKVSVAQIYMQRIKDVISPQKSDLRIRESKTLGIYIEGLTEVYVSSCEEVINLIDLANANRTVAATNMNDTSSRSHLLFIFTLFQNDLQQLSAKSSRVYLVDLAGSEKVSKTGAEGKVLDEAKGINKSLSALGNVINSLTEGKGGHVPYRDSKLTRILQESLGGNSRTLLIITCSPAEGNAQETLSTLRFGLRAKSIKNKPKVNKEYTVQELMVLLEKAEQKIRDQTKTINQLQSKLLRKKPDEEEEKTEPRETPPVQEVAQVKSILSSATSILDMVAQLERKEQQIEEEETGDRPMAQQSQQVVEQLKAKVAALEAQLLHSERNVQIERIKKEQFAEQLKESIESHKLKDELYQQRLVTIQQLKGQLEREREAGLMMQEELKECARIKQEIESGQLRYNQKQKLKIKQLEKEIIQLEQTNRQLQLKSKQKDLSIEALLANMERLGSSEDGAEQLLEQHKIIAEVQAQNQRLRCRVQNISDFQQRQKQFSKQEQFLFSNLRDRIFKVSELQEALDLERDKRHLLESSIKNNMLGQQLLLAEKASEQAEGKLVTLQATVIMLRAEAQKDKRLISFRQSKIAELQAKLTQLGKELLQLRAKVDLSSTSQRARRPQPLQEQLTSEKRQFKAKRMVKVFSSLRFPQLADSNSTE